MNTTYSGDSVRGNIVAPPSKSQTQRAIFLSSLAFGRSMIRNPLLCEDTYSMINAMRSFGAQVDERGGDLYISGGLLRAPQTIDCGNSGTTLRFLTAFCSLFHKPITLTGDASLSKRPMQPLLDALTQLGAECSEGPITVKGPIKGGDTVINGETSSQYVSALMMTAPFLENGLRIHVEGDLVSRPYITMTEDMMSKFNVPVYYEGNVIRVEYNGYRPAMLDIPGDYSSAAYPMTAAALAGNVSVYGLETNCFQGDMAITKILRDAGAETSRVSNATVVRQCALSGRTVDISSTPDLFPILAVLFSTASGQSKLYGAPHLRFKESDRIKSTVEMLRKLGADISEEEDGCTINGVPRLKGGTVDSHGDHRIAMAAAVASLVADGPVTVENSECVSVSYPNFNNDMRSIGMKVE